MEMEKKSRKSASKWNESSELLLIQLWKEKMSHLRGCRRNSNILLEMVAEMQNNGLSYTTEELKTKMHNMNARYRKEKEKIGITGGSPSEWVLFTVMAELLAPCRSVNSENLVGDTITDINSNSSVLSPLPSPSPSTSISTSSVPFAAPTPRDLLPEVTATLPISPQPSPSNTKTIKKDMLMDLIKKLDANIERSNNLIETTAKNTTEQQAKLQKYLDKEEEVQNAIISFFKRQ